MLAGLASFFAGLFSTTRMQDTAIDAVRKLGGLNEMSDKEKAQFLLDFHATTKHQSPIRRFIALLLTVVYVGAIVTWIVSAGVGYYASLPVSLEFAGAVKGFMESTIVTPFNIILSFYFVTQIAGKFGK